MLNPVTEGQEHSIDIQKTDVHPPFSPHNILNGKLIPLLRTSFRHPHLALPLRCPFITKEFIFLEAAAAAKKAGSAEERERREATLKRARTFAPNPNPTNKLYDHHYLHSIHAKWKCQMLLREVVSGVDKEPTYSL